MSIDIKKSFTFIFQDKNWTEKLIIGGLFFFAGIIIHIMQGLFNVFLGGFVMFYGFNEIIAAVILKVLYGILIFVMTLAIHAIPVGYSLQSAHNEINGEFPVLPEWSAKFLDYFKYGLGFFAFNFLYLFLIFLITAIPIVITSVILNLYQSNTAIYVLSIIFTILFVAPLVLFYIGILPFITMVYADSFKIQDTFKIDKIIKTLSGNLSDYLASIGITILVIVLFPVLVTIFACTCIGVLLIPFIVLPIILIIVNLFSQVYKQSKPVIESFV